MSIQSISRHGDAANIKFATVNIQRLILVAQLFGTIPPLAPEKQAVDYKGRHGKVHITCCKKSSAK